MSKPRIIATLDHLIKTFGRAPFRIGSQAIDELFEYAVELSDRFSVPFAESGVVCRDEITYRGCRGKLDASLPPHEVAWDYEPYARRIALAMPGDLVPVPNPANFSSLYFELQKANEANFQRYIESISVDCP